MGFFSLFDVRRKVRELEDAMMVIVEEQDKLFDDIRDLRQRFGGMKGAMSRWRSEPFPYEGSSPFLEVEGVESTDEPMSDVEFQKLYGCSPKEMADMKIRTGEWK